MADVTPLLADQGYASDNVIVVGSGLAGIAATCELLELGCTVTLIDKNPRPTTGNSSKASSGIFGAIPEMQKAKGIVDNRADLTAAATDPYSQMLLSKCGDAKWLLDTLNCKSFTYRKSLGHGAPRLLADESTPHQSGQELCARAATLFGHLAPMGKLTILRGETVTSLLTRTLKDGSVQVYGVEHCNEEDPKAPKHTVEGPVILSTGGYSGSAEAMRATNLSAVCDPRVDGSAMRLATKLGGQAVRRGEFTLTPFACAYPGEDINGSQEKFCLSSCLVGPGVAVFDGEHLLKDPNTGEFIKDLTKVPREEICRAMQLGKGPFTLVIAKAPEGTESSVTWYAQNKFLEVFSRLEACGNAMKIPEDRLLSLFGPIPKTESCYAVKITQAVYACCGGLKVGPDGECVGDLGVLQGLFAAGEAAAGPGLSIYSKAGMPLLHCVVSGRAAALGAAKAVFHGKSMPVRKNVREHFHTLAAFAEAALKEEEKKEEKEENLEEMSKEDLIKLAKALMANPPAAAGGAAAAPAAPPADAGISIDEVAKHNKKDDAWLVVNGDVLDVTGFIDNHPGGVQAIMAMVGKDATADWNAIHKPGLVEKVGLKSGAKKVGTFAGGGGAAAGPTEAPFFDLPPPPEGEPPLFSLSDEQSRHKPRLAKLLGFLGAGWIGALGHLLLNFGKNLGLTFLNTGNIRFQSERMGTIRSGLFLVFFTIAHSMDNQTTHLGRVQYNAMTYMMADRIQGDGTAGFAWFDMYIIMAVMLHAAVAIKRSWEINMGYTLGSGRWKWLITGLIILTFLIQHLCDFRFAADIDPSSVQMVEAKLPQAFIVRLDFTPPFVFFCAADDDKTAWVVKTRDVYTLEYDLFQRRDKVLQYVIFVCAVGAHLFWAWPKVITSDALAIPTGHQTRVKYIGWVMAAICCSLYISVPISFYMGIMPAKIGSDSDQCGGMAIPGFHPPALPSIPGLR